MVEEPSQASEGKSDSSPLLSGSFSPLSKGTSLTPLRDFPLADLSGESGRQLTESISEQVQTSNQNEFIVSVEDGNLRTPIALLVPPLEGAMVISTAGTSQNKTAGKELVLIDVSQTLSETHAREESETLLSDRDVSADIDTKTALLAQLKALQQELERTKAENIKFKAQVNERSSSSTSVNTQLIQLMEELQNIRTSMILRFNSIQTSQQQDSKDISHLTDSQSQYSDSILQIASISEQVNTLQTQMFEADNSVHFRFDRVDEMLEHLNEGMMHLYYMITKKHLHSAKHQSFFEGGPGGGGGGSAGGGSGSGHRRGNEGPSSTKSKSIEDSSTKGEKRGEDLPGKGKKSSGSGEDKWKGKQVISSDEDYYYQGEPDDFDAFNIQEDQEEQEELPCVIEFEQEALFDDWEEGEIPSDP